MKNPTAFALTFPTQQFQFPFFLFYKQKEEPKYEPVTEPEHSAPDGSGRDPYKVLKQVIIAGLVLTAIIMFWSPWKTDTHSTNQITAISQDDIKWLQGVTLEQLEDPEVLNKVASLLPELKDKINYKSLYEKLLKMICEKYPKLCGLMGAELNFDDISVEALDLPENVLKGLIRNYVYTIGDLKKEIEKAREEGKKKQKDWEEFFNKRIRGVGGNVADIVLKALRDAGVTIDGIIKGNPKGRLKNYLPNSEQLNKLDISEKAVKGLQQNGIKTVRGLMDFIEKCIHEGRNWKEELKKVDGVGSESVKTIDYRLQSRKLLNKNSRPVRLKPVPELPGETPLTRDFVGDNRIYNLLSGRFKTIEQVRRQLENDPQYFLDRPGVGSTTVEQMKKIFGG